MMSVSSVAPSIAQTIQSINAPQLPNFNVGTANVEANAAAATTSDAASSGSVGTCCGSSIDTYA
jgi:hypothetical protein